MDSKETEKIESYFLTRRINEVNVGYAILQRETPETLRYPAQYLYQEAMKDKGSKLLYRPHLGSYIKAYGGDKQNFEVQYHQLRESLYLTTRFFTFGLCQVGQTVRHKIWKFGNNVPMQLFICKEDSKHHFISRANTNNALVSKFLIQTHFDLTTVQKHFILPPGTIYFFYTISHCLFTVEVSDPGPPFGISEVVSEAAFLTARNVSLVEYMKNLIHNLPDSTRFTNIMKSAETVGIIAESDDDDLEISAENRCDEVGDYLRDVSVAMVYGLADRDERIAKLEQELVELRKFKPGPSKALSSAAGEPPQKAKRKLSFTLEERSDFECILLNFQERVNDLEEQRRRLITRADDIKKDLEQKHESKVKELELQKTQCEDTISKMQNRIEQLEVTERKYQESKKKFSEALALLLSLESDS